MLLLQEREWYIFVVGNKEPRARKRVWKIWEKEGVCEHQSFSNRNMVSEKGLFVNEPGNKEKKKSNARKALFYCWRTSLNKSSPSYSAVRFPLVKMLCQLHHQPTPACLLANNRSVPSGSGLQVSCSKCCFSIVRPWEIVRPNGSLSTWWDRREEIMSLVL